MIEVWEKDGLIKVSAEGSVNTISADACLILKTIYEQIQEESKVLANAFKENITMAIIAGVVFDIPLTQAADESAMLTTQAIMGMLDEFHNGEFNPVKEVTE